MAPAAWGANSQATVVLPADATNVVVARAELGDGATGAVIRTDVACTSEGTPCGVQSEPVLALVALNLTVSFDSNSFDPSLEVGGCRVDQLQSKECEKSGRYQIKTQVILSKGLAEAIAAGRLNPASLISNLRLAPQSTVVVYPGQRASDDCTWNQEYGGYEGENCQQLRDPSKNVKVRKTGLVLTLTVRTA